MRRNHAHRAKPRDPDSRFHRTAKIPREPQQLAKGHAGDIAKHRDFARFIRDTVNGTASVLGMTYAQWAAQVDGVYGNAE
ncbi:hypothetical protein [Nevskia sp.]|uniref:hypothetical protein n=1 Tax=Nevskia sp. TaxID=1929292 RepID=UPI0025EF65C3|nr:hypothetical protein [Nevskia sp.]